jgi:hypothetical protein
MNKYIGLAAAVAVVGMLAACGGQSEAPPAAAPAPAPQAAQPAPAPEAPMTMPAASHGGQMVMSGDIHAEIVANAEEVEAYFYDAQGKPITGDAAQNVVLQVSMSDGHRVKANLEVHGVHYTTGDVLKGMGVHAPYDGAISATINGQQAQFRFTAGG